MIKHNIKIAWRNLLKFKLQTSISILSLTVGMVCFALSALWLRYENSYVVMDKNGFTKGTAEEFEQFMTARIQKNC